MMTAVNEPTFYSTREMPFRIDHNKLKVPQRQSKLQLEPDFKNLNFISVVDVEIAAKPVNG